ncbi:response regulator receiver [Patulibacter medicamentivorans]|uniref:Response regulator receiver n=1 Tax=Patulibacter medicamentivorans TaxID=1097667 RepID=H0EBG9_9ACTN|nr:hypothetical protein [Patulibacter medicamentivorans]EHN08981.1 response regulator receiver [Patulibacter medicamentivorans]
MSTKKRNKAKRPGSPTHKRPEPASAARAEVVFDRIGRPEIDRILREQIGMSLAISVERSSVPAVQAFVDALEAEDDAVTAVREVEGELGIEPGAQELPELEPEQELKLLRADVDQERRIAEVDKRLLGICREALVTLDRRAVRAEKELEQAQRRTEQAQTQAGRHERRAEERVAESQQLRGRLDKAEAELESVRAELSKVRAHGEELADKLEDEAAAPAVPASTDGDVVELRARLAEREALLLDAHAEHERLEVALEAARRDVARLQHETGDEIVDGEDGEEPLPEVESVAEAVHVAAKRCSHLVFTERAFETAADSPFWRPDMILKDLVTLDKVAEAYLRPEGIGQPVGQLAQDLGLDWRSGVGEVWYGIHPNDYHFSHDGDTLRVAEHVRVANGAGAQRCARIYCAFHPGPTPDNDLPRGVYVGPVGRKLPDSTTG